MGDREVDADRGGATRWWAAALVAPAALVVLAARDATFHLDAAFAGTPTRFAAAVATAGGPGTARRASLLALALVVAWLIVVPAVLRAGWRSWAAPWRRSNPSWAVGSVAAGAAGVLGLTVGLGVVALAGSTAPPRWATLAITTLAWAAAAASAGSLVAICALVLGPLSAPWRERLGALVSSLPDRVAGRPRRRAAHRGAEHTPTATPPPVPTPASAPTSAPGSAPPPPSAPGAVPGPASMPTAATPAASQTAAPHLTGASVLAAATDTAADDPPVRGETSEALGICLSGGGIRSASVALGALRSLDLPPAAGRRSPFNRARWLSAVSGGAYVAGGWRATRHPGAGVPPPASATRDGLFDADGPWARSVAARHRFLDNGYLSLAGGLLGAAVRIVAVVATVLASAALAGWVVGRTIRSAAVLRRFPLDDGGTPVALGDLFQARLAVPWLVPLAIAGVAVVVGYARRSGRDRWRTVAVVAAADAAVVAVLCSFAPAAIHLMPGVYRRIAAGGGGTDQGAGIVGVLTSLGLVAAVVAALRARLKRRWMYLGGWLLLAGWVVFGGKVADTRARGASGIAREVHAGSLTIALPALALVVILAVGLVPSHRLNLGGIYRKRIAGTFALSAGEHDGLLDPLTYSDEPAWPAYAGASGPALIIAATAHASGRRFTGQPAYGFTWTADAVTIFDTPDGRGTAVAAADYPTGSWWRGYPRGWVVTRSMALTGAAFASAMGRQALGTTNALLAALNVRLGAWVPNPRHAEWFRKGHQPRVHLGYLAKEILGRYHPERDPFVYVADGGHRENLGLVELLRMHPTTIVVVDASGDRPGSFTTLAEAVELAEVELDVEIDIDLEPMRSAGDDLPRDCTAEGIVSYPAAMGGGTARLLYGHNQLAETVPHELLQFAATDPVFPDYSTGDQFLTDAQFHALVALGEHVGERLAARLDGPVAAIRPAPGTDEVGRGARVD